VIHHEKKRQKGFTIIEVILFLAISGMMMAGLLVAVSGGINYERYKDATNSLDDFLKEQYNLVDNVQNARNVADDGGLIGCKDATVAGTSKNCTIIGRYIASDADAVSITSWPVIATTDIVELLGNSGSGTSSDAALYEDMGLEVLRNVEEMTREYDLRWQTAIVAPGSSEAVRPFRMVLLRSPLSGTISTYIVGGFRETPKVSEVIAGTAAEKTYLCVDPRGLASFEQKTGISVSPSGVNSAAVQFATAGECRE